MSRSERARLYVGKLSTSCRERDIERLFSKYGRIVSCQLKYGFGFVEFDDERDAEDAVRYLDGYEMDGGRIAVQHSRGLRERGGDRGDRGRGGGPPGRSEYRIIAEGLDQHTSWQDLKDFARKAGNVVYTDVWSDRGEKMGVVEYSSRDDMEEALYSLDDTRSNLKR